MQKRCLNCSWEIRGAETEPKAERTRETLEHFTETGHTIVTLSEPNTFRPAELIPSD